MSSGTPRASKPPESASCGTRLDPSRTCRPGRCFAKNHQHHRAGGVCTFGHSGVEISSSIWHCAGRSLCVNGRLTEGVKCCLTVYRSDHLSTSRSCASFAKTYHIRRNGRASFLSGSESPVPDRLHLLSQEMAYLRRRAANG